VSESVSERSVINQLWENISTEAKQTMQRIYLQHTGWNRQHTWSNRQHT